MARFADVVEELVEVHGLSNLRWLTVQNEPNTDANALTLPQYEALYRALDAELVARGLGDHVQLMGGDLIEGVGAKHHTVWFEYMAEHMSDVLDAYSVHISGTTGTSRGWSSGCATCGGSRRRWRGTLGSPSTSRRWVCVGS